MCYPMAIMAVVSTVASIASTAMAAKANNDAAEQEMKNAVESTNMQNVQLQEQQIQVNDQAALEKLERQRQALRDRAQIRVGQGEAGIGGASAIRELNDASFQENYDLSIMEQNRKNAINQSVNTGRAVQIEGKSRWNNAKARRTSNLAVGLQIGGQALEGASNSYAAYKKYK